MTLLVSPSTMRGLEAEQRATGVSHETQIRTAGTACADSIRKRWPALQRVFVCAGPGNNGADALVCADALVRTGCSVTVITWHRPINDPWLESAMAAGAEFIENWDIPAVQSLIQYTDLVVDGLIGIGLNRAPEDKLAALITVLNARHARVPLVAIDIPTGCDAATGATPGVAVFADLTLSTGPRKVGLVFTPTDRHVGTCVDLDIGIKLSTHDRRVVQLLDAAAVAALLPARRSDAYKGTHGTLCVWAGSLNYPGAARLATLAAARSGTGIVSLAATPSVIPLAWPTPEITLTPLPDTPGDASLEVLTQSHFTSYLVGPGLGRAPGTAALLRTFLTSPDVAGRPVVLDADALTLLAGFPEWQSVIAGPTILTPHVGELRRLAGGHIAAMPPVELAQHYARTWGVVLVMKGAVTVIANPDGRVAVWSDPNPALASAGTGDVLAGVIAAFVAQHLDLYSAACLGVGLHGMAGRAVQHAMGDAGVLASDVIQALPQVMRQVRATV